MLKRHRGIHITSGSCLSFERSSSWDALFRRGFLRNVFKISTLFQQWMIKKVNVLFSALGLLWILAFFGRNSTIIFPFSCCMTTAYPLMDRHLFASQPGYQIGYLTQTYESKFASISNPSVPASKLKSCHMFSVLQCKEVCKPSMSGSSFLFVFSQFDSLRVSPKKSFFFDTGAPRWGPILTLPRLTGPNGYHPSDRKKM